MAIVVFLYGLRKIGFDRQNARREPESSGGLCLRIGLRMLEGAPRMADLSVAP
jgi:hypothetical protein